MSFDKEVYLKRKELRKECKTVDIEIDLEEETYMKLQELANQESIDLGDLVNNILYDKILDTFEKPEGIEKTIDSAQLLVHMDEIFQSEDNYLLVDSSDFNKKAVLITNKEQIEQIELMGKFES